MNEQLLKSCFILAATVGMILFGVSSKRNLRKIKRLFFKSKSKNPRVA